MEKSCARPWKDFNLQSPVSETDALSTHNVKLAAIFASLHCTLSTVYVYSILFLFMPHGLAIFLRICNNISDHGFDPLPIRPTPTPFEKWKNVKKKLQNWLGFVSLNTPKM